MSTLQARSLSRASASIVPQAARLELLEYYLVHYDDLDSPRAIAGQPSCCGVVGAGNAPANHSRTAG